MKVNTSSGIKAWSDTEKPRERLQTHDRRSLNDVELIAILLRSGYKNETAIDVSRQILAYYDHDLSRLGRADIQELSTFKGVGLAKAAAVIAALELGRRRKALEMPARPQITCSKDAYQILRPDLTDLTHEEFWVLLLDRAHRVLLKYAVSRGGKAMTCVDPGEVFKTALLRNAAAFIVAHNHPSGNLTASSADKAITQRLVQGGTLLGIPLLDHLIITDHRFLSMADEGLLV